MRRSISYAIVAVLCMSTVIVINPLAAAVGRVLHVATNGIDGATCGDEQTPCRSIGRAIANASAGDRILVGPGRYGYYASGEPSGCGAIPGALGSCLIEVDKPVRIESEEGAEATIIDASLNFGRIIRISSSGVVFGAPRRGFSIGGSKAIETGGTEFNDVTVAGNRIIRGGITMPGSGHTFLEKSVTGAQVEVVGGTGNRIERNVIEASDGYGLIVDGTNASVEGNLIVASFNSGLLIHGIGHMVLRNSFLVSSGAGILVENPSSGVVIRRNNIFGNSPPLGFPNPYPNCGLVNTSGSTVDARNNFWGAATGPGPDPADLACNSGAGSFTDTNPPARSEFPIRSR